MDSLSQIALGAAVGVAVMGRRTAVWKAAAWGAVAGTLPDLDVLVDHGDPVRNMVLHRAESHALFWLTLASAPLAALAVRVHGEAPQWRRWWLALWLALVTHPLLDAMTVYGTRLALPFSEHPYAVGSVFIIDPLYTLPLLAGVGLALARRADRRGLAANAAGLVLSTAYLGWGATVQQHVQQVARASLAAQGVRPDAVLATPSAFNTVLWRVVALEGDRYHEGFYSLFDSEPRIAFDRFERGTALWPQVAGVEAVQRLAAFSRGFFKLAAVDGQVRISDLRMGQEPHYVFSFVVAEQHSPLVPVVPSVEVGSRPPLDAALPWLWRRLRGEAVAAPR
ncbi:MAG TPA: metal-dependent hydrolase [Burkholderiaceae bacterium]|nr:metal-dependent hydrolase [Burkholderiaceae bacterium]